MIGRTPAIAIIGAGLGGLIAAAALRRVGVKVTVNEQAEQFARVGARIQMSPNAVRVNRALGLEGMLRATAFRPGAGTNREWDSGEVKFEFPLVRDILLRAGRAAIFRAGRLPRGVCGVAAELRPAAGRRPALLGLGSGRGVSGSRRYEGKKRPEIAHASRCYFCMKNPSTVSV
jgi:NADPH-dependent 2,4-dienoyl-CoA reductase/sulfur reductase-like enzyme